MRCLLLLVAACGGSSSATPDAPDDPLPDAEDAELAACRASTLPPGDCFTLTVTGDDSFTREVCPFSCSIDDAGQIGFLLAQTVGTNQFGISLRWQLPTGETNADVEGRVLATGVTAIVRNEPTRYETEDLRIFVEEYTPANVKACVVGSPAYATSGGGAQVQVSTPLPVVINCVR